MKTQPALQCRLQGNKSGFVLEGKKGKRNRIEEVKKGLIG